MNERKDGSHMFTDIEEVNVDFEEDPLGVDIVPHNTIWSPSEAADIAYKDLKAIAGLSGLQVSDLVRMVETRERLESKEKARRAKARREEGRKYGFV